MSDIIKFNTLFRNDKIKVFIIVEDSETGNSPVITLIHRMRFGSTVLPIPAWLKKQDAEQTLQSWVKSDESKVIGISHANLQAMIDNRNYDVKCGNVISYYLDLQAEQFEIEEILHQY